MDASKDYYKILSADPSYSAEQLRVIYHNLARTFHPDAGVFDKKVATAKMQEINEAYEILSDPIKRKQYDNIFSGRKKNPFQHTKSKHSNSSHKPKKYASEKQIKYAKFLLYRCCHETDCMDEYECQDRWDELNGKSSILQKRIRDIIDELKEILGD